MQNREASRRVLVVADDTTFASSVEGILRGIGVEVMILSKEAELTQAFDQFRPDLALFNVDSAATSAIAMIPSIKSSYALVKLVAVVASDSPDRTELAKRIGFDAVIPLPSSRFVSTICDLLEIEGADTAKSECL